MLKKPTFPTIMLIVALGISTIAEIYSVIGLATIFAGAKIPVMIFGALLGIGKIIAVMWLRKNWTSAPFMLKYYLLIASIVLSIITSIGIFGFLSKAHSVSGLTQTNTTFQVKQIDNQIKQLDAILADKKATLALMDRQVSAVMDRGTDIASVNRSFNIRKQQTNERQSIQTDITDLNNKISELNIQKAPLEIELQKLEAEVGPLKYIAQIVYGDKADTNTLEKAVQWLTMILVMVFDPLAIALVLAAGHAADIQPVAPAPKPKRIYNRKKKVDEVKVDEPVKPKRKYTKKPKVTDDQSQPKVEPVAPKPTAKRKGKHPLADEVSGITRKVFKTSGDTVIHEGVVHRKEELKQTHPKLFMSAQEESLPVYRYDWLFPVVAANGDTLMRIDCIPHKKYVFNEGTWKMVGECSQHDCIGDPEYVSQVETYLEQNPDTNKNLYM